MQKPAFLAIPSRFRRLATHVVWRVAFALSFVAVALALTTTARAATIYVRADAAAGGNGQSWATAYNKLHLALAQVDGTTPTEIWIKNGVYKPDTNARTATFTLKGYLTLRGGFLGTETEAEARPAFATATAHTVLSGDINSVQADAITSTTDISDVAALALDSASAGAKDNVYNVLTAVGLVGTVTLDHLVVANGFADDTAVPYAKIETMIHPSFDGAGYQQNLERTVCGGGLFANASSVSITNCAFVCNYANALGGAIVSRNGALTLESTTVARNYSTYVGGGAAVQDSFLDIHDSTFYGNVAAHLAGGLYTQSATDLLTVKSYLSQMLVAFSALNYSSAGIVPAGPADPGTPQDLVQRFKTKVQNYDIGKAVALKAIEKAEKYVAGKLVDKLVATFTSTATSSYSGPYNLICKAVDVMDIGVTLAVLLGADPNDPFIQGWSTFNEGFSTYATPAGLAKVIYGVAEDLLGVEEPQPTFATRVTPQRIKEYADNQNKAASPVLTRNRFERNFSGAIGGGVVAIRTNVVFHGSYFIRNEATLNGGAGAFFGYNTVFLESCIVQSNRSQLGHSGFSLGFRNVTNFYNDTIIGNKSLKDERYAIGVEAGAEAFIASSLLWGNTNVTKLDGGADVFAARFDDLDEDGKQSYHDAGDMHGMWTGTCDIQYSNLQGLGFLVLGTEQFTEEGFDLDSDAFRNLDNHGPDYAYMPNMGEGIRPGVTWGRSNFSKDPMLLSGFYPHPRSPLIDAGSNTVAVWKTNIKLDIQGEFRNGYPERVDIGAFESDHTFPASTILYVKPLATGTGDGLTWANASDLLTALNQPLAPGGQIWMAPGVYVGSGSFYLRPGVTLLGSMPVNSTSAEQSTPITTTIAGPFSPLLRGNTDFTREDIPSQSIEEYEERRSLPRTVSGIHFTGARGGPALRLTSNVVVERCSFSDNAGGSALLLETATNSSSSSDRQITGTAQVISCLFQSNPAGALESSLYNLDVLDSQFYDNTSLRGGAIYFRITNQSHGKLKIERSIFAGNAATAGRGGALHSNAMVTTIAHSIFVDNTATPAGGDTSASGGAAIWTLTSGSPRRPTLFLYNSILRGNRLLGGLAASTSVELQQIAVSDTIRASILGNNIEGLNLIAPLGGSAGNMDYDPYFVNAAAHDYRLGDDSLLLNRGVTYTSTTDDTPITSVADIGLTESTSTVVNSLQPVLYTEVQPTDDARVFTFEITGATAPTAIQWEVRRPGGGGFVPVTADLYTSGASATTLTLTNPPHPWNGSVYRARFTSSGQRYYTEQYTLRAPPSILYVSPGGAGNQDGTTWANAMPRPSLAATISAPFTQIWVAGGTYTNTDTARLAPGARIYGGFAGHETTRAQRVPGTNETILSQNARPVIDMVGKYFYPASPTPFQVPTIVDNVTVAGQGTYRLTVSKGAYVRFNEVRSFDSDHTSLLADYSRIVLEACEFSGGARVAFMLNYTSAELTDCSFTDNGGAIHTTHGQLTLTDCLFAENDSTWGTVFIEGNSPFAIQRCRFLDNSCDYSRNLPGPPANGQGAAINTRSRMAGSITNSLFAGNSVGIYGHGGAIYQEGFGVLTMNHLTVADNVIPVPASWNFPDWGGAIYIRSGSSATLSNSIVWGNTGPQVVNATVINSIVEDRGNVTDPIFVGGGDYHLTANSPVLNLGVATDAVVGAFDLDLTPRRHAGGNADLGAYEFAGAPGVPFLIAARPKDQSFYTDKPVTLTATRPSGTSTVFAWEYYDGGAWVDITTLPGWTVVQTGDTSTLSHAGLTGGLTVRAVIPGVTSYVATVTVKSRRILHVDTDAASSGDGLSWPAAFRTIQEAMAQADLGTDIWIAEGTYTSSTPIQVKNGVRIYGGFDGTENALGARDVAVHAVTITSPGSRTIEFQGALDRTTLIDGVTFSGPTGQYAVGIGSGARPTFNQVTFRDTTQAVYVNGSASPLFTACRFENNSVYGLAASFADVTVENTLFTQNSGVSLTGYAGNNVIRDSRFLGNTGPCIDQNLNSLVLERTVITGNSAATSAVSIHDADVSISDSLLAANLATSGPVIKGHGNHLDPRTLTVRRTTIADNDGGTHVGGIFLNQLSADITDSLLWRNTGARPYTTREGQQFLSEGSGFVRIHGSTLDGLSSLASTGTGNTRDDPLFVNAANGDYSLDPLSPAIDAALGTPAPASGALDVLGQARVSGNAADRGALESPYTAAATPLRLAHDLDERLTFGTPVSFQVSVNRAATVTWQVSQDQGAFFADVTADATHVITDTDTGSRLTLSGAALNHGDIYRFVLSGSVNYTSPSALLTVATRPIVYVDASAAGAGTGTSWPDAYPSLGDALAASPDFAEVRIAAGTYRAPVNGTFPLRGRQHLLGGYPVGGGTRDASANRTVLSGAIGATTAHIILTPEAGLGVDDDTVLDGLVFRDGGIGISLASASPAIRNCRFENLPANAIKLIGAGALIEDCVFEHGRQSAINALGAGTLTINRCEFTDNTTPGTNVATNNGGALQLNSGPRALIADSLFTANRANNGGAIFANNQSSVTVVRSRFTANLALSGAAIATSSGSLFEARDSLFAHNQTSNGSALRLLSDATLINVTVVDNLGTGAAIHARAALTVSNSILWGNTATQAGEAAQLESPSAILAHTLIQGLRTRSGSQLLPFAPRFVDAANGDYRLAADSPAVDAGLASVLLEGETDLLGAARSQGGTVDLGAYESAGGAAPLYALDVPTAVAKVAGGRMSLSQIVPPGFSGSWQYWDGSQWQDVTTGYALPGAGNVYVTLFNNALFLDAGFEPPLDGRQFRWVLSGASINYESAPILVSILGYEIIHVDASRAGVGAGDGLSWATAYKTLAEGLNAISATRRVIHLAEGSYQPPAGQSFALPQRFELRGGYHNGGTERDPALHPSILSGAPLVVNGPRSATVLSFTNTLGSGVPQAVVDGVTIADGATGVRIDTVSPVLRNLVIRDHNNGGLVLVGSGAQIENTVVTGNTTPTHGGGISVTGGAPVFTGLTLRGNSATGNGGGVYLAGDSRAKFNNALVAGNLADIGGGFYFAGGASSLLQVTVADNRARLTGGIHTVNSLVSLNNALVWGNRATTGTIAQAQTTTANVQGSTARVSFDHTVVEAATASASLWNDDPFFTAPAGAAAAPTLAGDYSVAASSSSIGRGGNALSAGLAFDVTGTSARLIGTTVDLGAYEFGGAALPGLFLNGQPASFAYNRDGANTLAVNASGASAIAWEYLAPGDSVWTSAEGLSGVSGADTATLTFTLTPPALNGYQFRALLTAADGRTLATTPATLSSYPARYYVDASRDGTDAGDGLAWVSAFRSLNTALATIPVDPAGTEVWVAAGTYSPSAPAGFKLWRGLSLYGGFTGSELLRDERDPANHATILAGIVGTTSVARSDNRGPAATAFRLDGFTVQGAPRGLLVADGFKVEIANNTFQSLTGTALETGIGLVSVTTSRFLSNQRGLVTTGTTLLIDRCEFRGNDNPSDIGAGAYLGRDTAATVSNSLFSGNRARSGAGLWIEGHATITQVTFTGNFTSNPGSAIYASTAYGDGHFSLYNSIVHANSGEQIYTLRNLRGHGCVVENRRLDFFPDANGNRSEVPDFLTAISASAAPTLAGDFRIGGGATFVDAGLDTYTTLPGFDLDGASRKSGAAVDPGAYEFAGTPLRITSQPADAFASFATGATYSVAASASASYQWQVGTGATTWADLSDDANRSGTLTDTLHVAGLASLHGLRYRAVVTFGTGFTLASQSAGYTYFDVRPSSAGIAGGGALPPGQSNFAFSLGGGVIASSVNASSLFVSGPQSGRLTTGAVNVAGSTATIDFTAPLHAGERFWVTTTSGILRADDNLSATPQVWEFRAGVNSGPGFFDAPLAPASADLATALAAGDVDQDGHLDLVAAGPDGLIVYRNDGQGAFAAAAVLGGGANRSVVFSDLNGDGASDLIVVKTSGTVEIWLNAHNGLSDFSLVQTLVTSGAQAAAGGDLDADGDLDLFIATSSGARVWKNNGSGVFTDSLQTLGSADGLDVALGDVNHDGSLDALVAQGTSAFLWLNQGGGTFASGTGSLSPYPAKRVALVDFNADGFLDAALAADNTPVRLLYGFSGSFLPTVNAQYPLLSGGGGGSSAGFAVGDTDGDGHLDFLGTDSLGEVGAWTRQGNGTYARASLQPALTAGSSPVLADFDGDGALDLASIHPISGLPVVSLYLVTPTHGDEDTAIGLTAGGFTHGGGPGVTHVRIVSLPAHGTLAGVSVNDTLTLGAASALIFTPVADYNGLDSFTFSISTDGGLNYGAAVFTHLLLVRDTPDAVAPEADAFALAQGDLLSVTDPLEGVLTNDYNGDAGTLAATLVSSPAHGTLVLNADGTFTYQHDDSESRDDSFVYRATNLTTNRSADATVTLTIANVNGAPTGATLTRAATTLYTGQSAEIIVGTLAGLDPDPEDADAHTFALVAGAGDTDNALFALAADGFTLKSTGPLPTAGGLTRSVRVSVTDPSSAVTTQVLTIVTIQAPTLAPASLTTDEDAPLSIAAAAQGGAAALSHTLVNLPAHGTLTGSNGHYVYAPDLNFHGADSFTVNASDGTLNTGDITFTLTVTPVNDAPEAATLSLATDEDIASSTLILTATDIDGDTPLTFSILEQPHLGTVSLNGNEIVYTPTAHLNGVDSFLYVANDGQLDSAPARVTVTVTSVNDLPTFDNPAPASVEIIKDTPYTFVASVAHDDDSGTQLTYRVDTAPAHGSVSLDGHVISYFPDAGYRGSDVFTIIAGDGQADTDPLTVNVTVTNPVPVALSYTVDVNQHASANFTLLASDLNNDLLSYDIINAPAQGTLAGGYRDYVYTPAADFSGTDTLTFIARDIDGSSELATITFNVVRVNLPPVAAAVTGTYDGLLPAIPLTLSGTDPEGAVLTYRITQAPAHGTLAGSGAALTYTLDPAPFTGTDEIKYVVNDGEADSAEATVSLTFTKTIGTPDTVGDLVSVYRGVYEDIDVLANDSDAWGTPLTIQAHTSGVHGTVSVSAGGLRYTHNGDTATADEFTYTVSNGDNTKVEHVSVTITPRTIAVTDFADNGADTLREALATVNRFNEYPLNQVDDNGDPIVSAARPDWLIQLNADETNNVIELSSFVESDELLGDTALVIEGRATIDSGVTQTTLTRGPGSASLRLLRVASGATVTLRNIAFTEGVANRGGAIYNEGSLTLEQVDFSHNTAKSYGNDEPGLGGAIFNSGGTLVLDDATFDANVADDAGGLYQAGGTTTAAQAVFSGHGTAKDFRNTGGATFIAGDLTTEAPTAPWFEAVPDATVAYRFTQTVNVLLTSGQTLVATNLFPPFSAVGHDYTVSGQGPTRTLTGVFTDSTQQGPHELTLTATGDGATFLRQSEITVDKNLRRPLVARDDYLAIEPNEVLDNSVLLRNDEEPDGRPLHVVDLIANIQINTPPYQSPTFGAITTVQGLPRYTAPAPNGYQQDAFTYQIESEGQTAIASVYLVIRSRTVNATSSNDSGSGSLRSQLALADTYRSQPWLFRPSGLATPVVTATTIGDADPDRGDSAFVINGDVTIDGANQAGFVIRRGATAPAMRLFRIAPGAKLTLRNLTVEGGLAALGGGIYNEGTLVLDHVTVQGNHATATGTTVAGLGGAIYNAGGTVTLVSSDLLTNFADAAGTTLAGKGGGLYTRNGTVTFTDSSAMDNTSGPGGGVYAEGKGGAASVTFVGSVLANPDATNDLDSRATHGGTVAFYRTTTPISRIHGPWVDSPGTANFSFNDTTDNGITDYAAGNLTFSFNDTISGLTLSAASSVQSVIPNSSLTIGTGTGFTRELGFTPLASGRTTLDITATSQGVSFHEVFDIRALAGPVVNPSLQPHSVSLYLNESATADVVFDAVDVYGLPVFIDSITPPAHGTAVITDDNKIRYTNTSYSASGDNVVYTVRTALGGTATGTLHINLLQGGATVANFDALRTAIAQAATHPTSPWLIKIAASAANQTWFPFNPYSGNAADGFFSEFKVTANVVIDGTDAPGFAINGMSGPPARHFVVLPGASLTLKNLKLVNGYAYGAGTPMLGGAVLNFGTFTADRVVFQNNQNYSFGSDPGRGGAIYNAGGNVTLTQCDFINNQVTGAGGAIYSRNGTLALNAVTFSGNSAPTGKDIYVLGDGAAASVAFTGTPVGSNWFGTLNGGSITSNGLPVTSATAADDTLTRPSGRSLKISLATLTANDGFAGPNSARTVVSGATSAGGATLTRSGGFLFYTPDPDFNATDTFTYTVTDSLGVTTSATVTIHVATPPATPTATTLSIATREGGGFVLRLVGIPGRLYTIQVSTDLANWSELATATADAQGLYTIEDPITPPPGTGRFYRAVYNN